ncbi:MAG: M6 family metalloprotease domain-containing protein [Syntrophobacteraceae bacterium]
MRSRDLETSGKGQFERLPGEFICQAREASIGARTKTAGFLLLLLFSAAILFPGAHCYAGPALDKPFLIAQPDGESFQARLRGDEWYNWTENLNGYAIEKGEDEVWYYVDTSVPPQPEAGITAKHPLTGARAQEPPPEGLQKFVPPVDAGPPRGDLEKIAYAPPKGAFNGNLLLILAQFNDTKGGTTPEAWNNVAPGSLSKISHYYGKASYGLVSLKAARESRGTANDGVIGWLNVSARLKQLEIEMQTEDKTGNHPNTGGSTGGVAGMKLRLLAKAAIIQADPYIDYARYDADGNGIITPDELAIQIVVAGYDASSTVPGDAKSVWAHAWTIPSGSIGLPVVDGKKISNYSMVGELHGGPRHQATMGQMAHELGHHIFGWIDLYNTKTKKEGIGPWDVMATGAWGKMAPQPYYGQTPVLPSAYTKMFSKWIEPHDAGNGTGPRVALTNAGTSSATKANTACLAKTGLATQYFLVEARDNIGYDKGLQAYLGRAEWAGGIAIWHIDKTVANNQNDDHRRVSLEAANNADGVDHTYAKTGVLWRPGKIFGHWSTPDSRTYSWSQTHWAVMDILERAEGMSASVVKDGQLTVTINPPAAVTAGAKWRACPKTGPCSPWLQSGLARSWYPGKSTVSFKSLAGWTSPADLELTLEPNGNVALSATYKVIPVLTTSCSAQLNDLATVWDGTAKVWSTSYSATGKVVGTVFSGQHTDDFWHYTDTMTAKSSGSPSKLVELKAHRAYSQSPVTSDLTISGGSAQLFDVRGGTYRLTGTAVCDAMQFSATGLDSYSCRPDTEFYLDCSSFYVPGMERVDREEGSIRSP